MNPTLIGLIGISLFFFLVIIGMPFGFSLAFVGFLGCMVLEGFRAALNRLATVPYTSVSSYMLSLIPLFILMGELASDAGIIKRAYSFARKWLGHLPGGLAIATISACGAFAAVCGSSLASAGIMTSVAYPEMKRYKYEPKLAAGCIAAGGTLGILIPPSTVMVVYGMFAQQSIGKLFIAGILPGILLMFLFIISIFILCIINPSLSPLLPGSSWKERIFSISEILPTFLLFGIVMGGIWGGIFTPTEAAGVGVTGTLLIGLVYRELKIKNIISSLMKTITITAMIFTILIGAMIFNYFMTLSDLPSALAKFVASIGWSPISTVLAISTVYIILGCFMDSFAMTVLTLPIFLPLLRNMNIDLIWFGVLFVVLVETGLLTPPLGMNVYVVGGMVKNDINMQELFRAVTPFILCLVLCLTILIIFPEISLFLPRLMR